MLNLYVVHIMKEVPYKINGSDRFLKINFIPFDLRLKWARGPA